MVDELTELRNVDRSLFPGSLTIRALRDSRYHNSAYAIAELIDNSIEAGAEQIELLCMKRPEVVRDRERPRVSGIAVLDNGTGMDARTLLHALKFGGGTHHESRRGIGKYGMGLPTSSMSQCKTVDVWTWQDGLDSAWHSRIDADAIEAGDHEVPLPDRDTPIPEPWRVAGCDKIFRHHSGTLVVWSQLDKMQWRTAKALIDNTAREIGRMHRHLIYNDITRIRTAAFLEHRPAEVDYGTIVANDPLYLMSGTTVPEEPWDQEPMFRKWHEKEYDVIVDGRTEKIGVTYSIVKPEALRTERPTQNPGDRPRGKHARHNIGVSVVREEREITLEGAFLREGGSAEQPQNRWWGCEVEFPRGCDELFGIDPNKQMVANFTEAAKTLARDDRRHEDILDELGLEEDPIHRIVAEIRDQTRTMMREIGRMFAQIRKIEVGAVGTTPKTPESKAAKTATDADRDAIDTGREPPTKTDRDRTDIPPDERESGLTEQFIRLGQADQDARGLARRLIEEGLSYQFNHDQLDGFQMFNVRSNQGILHINLNTDHPIYRLLDHIEDDLDEDADEDDPAFQASVAIRLLLSSWARMEDQTDSQDERMRIQDIAMTWGRQVDKVIRYMRERDD